MFKIFKRKNNQKWAVLMVVILGVFLKIKTAKAIVPAILLGLGLAASAYAWFEGINVASATLFTIVGGLASFFSWVVGHISIVFTSILLGVVKYNDFIKEEVVLLGWPIIRDLCNMFFVLILLIIAFATILRVENYHAKKLLPKLLIMAVLINFSKTICGLAIDFAQVIMLTFTNAFGNAGAGNLYNAFGIQKLFSWETFKDSASTETNVDKNLGFAVAGSMILGLIMLLIFTVVIGIYTIILVFRIIMLWILIILSPLAFLAMIIPAGAKYAQQWTSEFSKYVIIGPVMAFFLWLALSISVPSALPTGDANNIVIQALGTGSEASQPANMKQFMVSTLFLLAALMMAQQAGVAGGGMAGGFVGKVKGWGTKAGLAPLKGAGMLTSFGARKFSKHAFEIRPTKIIGGIKESFEKTTKDDNLAARERGGELLGKGGIRGVIGGLGAGKDYPDQYINGFMNIKGFKNMGRSLRWGQGSMKKLGEKYESIEEKELKPRFDALSHLKNDFQDPEERKETKRELTEVDEAIDKLRKEDATETDDKKKEEIAAKVEELLGRKGILEIDYKKNTRTKLQKDEQNKIKKEIEDIQTKKLEPIQKQIDYARPPESFEARAAYRSLVDEELVKLKDTKNAEQLLMYYDDAVRKKDKYRVAAIAEKLFNDANGNELMNAQKFSSDAVGLHKFIHDREKGLVNGLKLLSEQEGLQLQSDLSEAAERVNHWEMAKTVGVNRSGKLESLIKKTDDGKWDDSRHAKAAAAEIFKIDPQLVMRMLNRLAFGGETPDGKGGREFNMTTLGKIITKGFEKSFEDHKNRILGNTAFNLAKPHVQEQMREAGVSEKTINIFYNKGTQKGKTIDPSEIIRELEKKGLHLTDDT